MRTLRRMSLLCMFGLLLGCMFTAGCDFRTLTDQDVAGTYEASADWGRSTLVLHPDHTFDQTVVRNTIRRRAQKGHEVKLRRW